MGSNTPPFLKKNSKVAIVATARFVDFDFVNTASKVLEGWGLKVVVKESLFEKQNQFAGSDELRTLNFQEAIDDNEIEAVFIARGGYGTLRIIDHIDFANFNKSPKWIVGFSDITVLHSHIHSRFNIETLHGPMPITFNYCEESLQKMKDVLFGLPTNYTFSSPKNLFYRPGESQGVLVGGNLSILYALQSSSSDIKTADKILFIEDIDEYLYHLDRMMLSLKRANKLSNLKGLIVGSMMDMKDNTIPFGSNANEIILEAVKEFDFPVAFGIPCGHDKSNFPLILGRTVKLKVEGEFTQIEFINEP